MRQELSIVSDDCLTHTFIMTENGLMIECRRDSYLIQRVTMRADRNQAKELLHWLFRSIRDTNPAPAVEGQLRTTMASDALRVTKEANGSST